MSPPRMSRFVLLAILALGTACTEDSPTAPTSEPDVTAHRARSARRFTDWSAPVNIGAPVNTGAAEQAPAISKDGRSLYFHCINCPGGFGGIDIWVAQRASVGDPWGPPQNLGPAINTASNDGVPSLSADGRWLYFNSNRPGGLGGNDLYAARRSNEQDDLGWEPAAHLGTVINSAGNDVSPHPFVDRRNRTTSLYFVSDRPGGLGGNDIYRSMRGSDGTFGPATLVPELSSPFSDQSPAIRRDGLEVYLASDRPGTVGQLDLWVSTRERTTDPWSAPATMGPLVNGTGIDAGLELSFDGTALYFHSAERAGNVGGPFFDIWLMSRSRLHGDDDDGDHGDEEADRGSRGGHRRR